MKVPKVPRTITPFAREVLARLESRPAAHLMILGGGLALNHYLDFRETQDIDFWWRQDSGSQDRSYVWGLTRSLMVELAAEHGRQLKERVGVTADAVSSLELVEEYSGGKEKKVFAVQIAGRDVQLEPAIASPWAHVDIESFNDNVASKMAALVDRGQPRDFIDIKAVNDAGLVTPEECWRLWSRKQVNPLITVPLGQQQVLHRLAAIELRRPLSSIKEADERNRAATLRDWYKNTFLDELREHRHDKGLIR